MIIGILRFTIDGRPVPKMRAKTSTVYGKVRTRTPDKTVAYEAYVGQCGAEERDRKHIWWPLDARYSVRLVLNVAKTKEGNFRELDGDNIEKSLMDGLQAVLWNKDSQVDGCRWDKIHVDLGDPEFVEVEVVAYEQ